MVRLDMIPNKENRRASEWRNQRSLHFRSVKADIRETTHKRSDQIID
jgi:hypothetical protein